MSNLLTESDETLGMKKGLPQIANASITICDIMFNDPAFKAVVEPTTKPDYIFITAFLQVCSRNITTELLCNLTLDLRVMS